MDVERRLKAFIDQNLLDLTRKTEGGFIRLTNVYNDLDLLGSSNATTDFMMTPVGALEALGIKPSKLLRGKPLSLPKTGDVFQTFMHEQLEESKRQLENTVELQPEYLRSQYEAQLAWCEPDTKEFFRDMLQTYVDGDLFQWACEQLAFDHVNKICRSSSDAMYHIWLAVEGFFSPMVSVTNLSKYRVCRRLWDLCYNRQRVLSDEEGKSCLDRANEKISIDNRGDYLDCDLVHFACYGVVESFEEPPIQSIILTMDDLDMFLFRCACYSGCAIGVRKYFLDLNDTFARDPDYVETFVGAVVQINRDFEIVGSCEIADVDRVEPIDFLSAIAYQ